MRPLIGGFEILERRWASQILLTLGDGPKRFNAALRAIPGISDRVLTQRLQEMADAGLLQRRVHPGPPVRVSYQLTTKGDKLVMPLSNLVLAAAAAEAADLSTARTA